MKLILYPLVIMFILTAMSQLIVYSNIDYTYSNTNAINPATGQQTINETETGLEQSGSDAIFNVNMTTGLIALIIALVVVGAVAGIRILGSGLSTYSVQLIHKAAVYYGLWGIFSALSYIAFASIPFFGVFLWIGLTLIYTLGFYQTLNSAGGADE